MTTHNKRVDHTRPDIGDRERELIGIVYALALQNNHQQLLHLLRKWAASRDQSYETLRDPLKQTIHAMMIPGGGCDEGFCEVDGMCVPC